MLVSDKAQKKKTHFCAQSEASIYHANKEFSCKLDCARACLARAGELSSIWVKSWDQKTKEIFSILVKQNETINAPTKEMTDCELIEAKFVNIRVFLEELHARREHRVCTHPSKFGNHVTLHQPSADRPSAPQETSVYSHTF